MPISSGFGYYPYNYPTTITQRVVAPGVDLPGHKVKLDSRFALPWLDSFLFWMIVQTDSLLEHKIRRSRSSFFCCFHFKSLMLKARSRDLSIDIKKEKSSKKTNTYWGSLLTAFFLEAFLLWELRQRDEKFIVMSRLYYEYLRENPPMKKYRSGGIGKIAFGTKVPPRRPPPEGKQSPRSDTSNLTHKRHDVNGRSPPKAKDQVANGTRRIRAREPVTVNVPAPVEERRREPKRMNAITRFFTKQPESSSDLQDYGRKPLRFESDDRRTSRHSLPPPAPVIRDVSNRARPIHVEDSNYILERRRRQPVYVYEDYPTVGPYLTHLSTNWSFHH